MNSGYGQYLNFQPDETFQHLCDFTPFVFVLSSFHFVSLHPLYSFYGEGLHRYLCRAGDVASASVMAFEKTLAAEWRNSKNR